MYILWLAVWNMFLFSTIYFLADDQQLQDILVPES